MADQDPGVAWMAVRCAENRPMAAAAAVGIFCRQGKTGKSDNNLSTYSGSLSRTGAWGTAWRGFTDRLPAMPGRKRAACAFPLLAPAHRSCPALWQSGDDSPIWLMRPDSNPLSRYNPFSDHRHPYQTTARYCGWPVACGACRCACRCRTETPFRHRWRSSPGSPQ